MSTIQVRRGTAASATSNNPTLADGEIGYETDTGKYKIGDGSTAWNSLDYAPGAFSVGDLGDVDTTTSAPSSGDALVYDGSNWVPDSVTYAGAGGGAATGTLTLPGVGILGSGSTQGTAANRAYYFPFLFDTARTVDSISWEVTTAAAGGSLARWSLYQADANWQPDALIVDAGTAAVDATGIAQITGLAQAVPAGRVLLKFHSDGAPTFRYVEGTSPVSIVRHVASGNKVGAQLYVAETFAAAADPGTNWNTVTYLNAGFQYFAWLGLA